MPPPRLAGIDHLVLRIADKAAMVAFYCDVVGCSVDRDRPELGLTHLRAGAALIDLVIRDRGEGPARNLDHLCLQVLDFDPDALKAHLAGHGVAVLSEGLRYGAQGEAWSIYVTDPEGNMVELKAAAG